MFSNYPSSVTSSTPFLYELCVSRIRFSSSLPEVVLSMKLIIILMETPSASFSSQSIAQFPTLLLPFLVSDRPSVSQPGYDLLSFLLQDQMAKHAFSVISQLFSSFTSLFSPFLSALPSLPISEILSTLSAHPLHCESAPPFSIPTPSSYSLQNHLQTPGGTTTLSRTYLRLLSLFITNTGTILTAHLEAAARTTLQCVCYEEKSVCLEVLRRRFLLCSSLDVIASVLRCNAPTPILSPILKTYFFPLLLELLSNPQLRAATLVTLSLAYPEYAFTLSSRTIVATITTSITQFLLPSPLTLSDASSRDFLTPLLLFIPHLPLLESFFQREIRTVVSSLPLNLRSSPSNSPPLSSTVSSLPLTPSPTPPFSPPPSPAASPPLSIPLNSTRHTPSAPIHSSLPVCPPRPPLLPHPLPAGKSTKGLDMALG